MERDIKRFSSWAARRYFGVDSRPNPDENHREKETAETLMDMHFAESTAESQLYHPHPSVEQAMPPPSLGLVCICTDQSYIPVIWKKINPMYEVGSNDTVQPRHGHRAVAFNDLMVVFSGGNEGIFREMVVYNTATNKWFKPPLKGEVPPGKASYGAAIVDGHRLLIFGGMEERQPFSDTLYECNLQTWEWKLLAPCGRTPSEKPDGRIGHSFTEVDGRIFMFGGLGMVKDETGNAFVDWKGDLYVLYPELNNQQGLWEKPTTFGNQPLKRESHAAVAYVSKNSRDKKLVIFGGTRNVRLGDIHSLNVNTMMWTEIESKFTPRSLHTATLVGSRVYIFGGWLARDGSKSGSDHGDDADQFMCFNLATMSWETDCHSHFGTATATLTPIASGRAGHSAVAIDENIYMWSGRCGQKRENGRQVCWDDFWMLDVSTGKIPVYFSKVTTQQITPDTDGQVPFDLSLVKNERFSPEPPDVPQDMQSEMSSMSPSRDFVADFINAIDAEVVHQNEQQSQAAEQM